MKLDDTIPYNKHISESEYNRLVSTSRLIVSDLLGPKVMRHANGNIIKIFRRKRFFSSAMFAPYAIRFINNALRLRALDIPTVTPLSLQYCPANRMHIVEYEPLEGDVLRGILQSDGTDEQFILTARFIAELHHKGVYFRSLHFENIVKHDDRLGLIDIADMKIYRHPLSPSLRQRNFQHFMRYPQDAALIRKFGEEQFHRQYLAHQTTLESALTGQ